MPTKPELSPDLLQAALQGLELQRQRLDQQISELTRMLRMKEQPVKAPALGDKRTMTAAARKRIAEAQKKRWQEYHKAHKPSPAAAPAAKAPAKRKLSAAGRKAIAAAARKRWAAVRRAKKGAAK